MIKHLDAFDKVRGPGPALVLAPSRPIRCVMLAWCRSRRSDLFRDRYLRAALSLSGLWTWKTIQEIGETKFF